MSILYRNSCTDQDAFVELPSTYAKLCFNEIRISPKIRVLTSETLFQTLDFENMAMAH